MAEHFKLEITNRSTKITTWTGVSDDFANEYKERLGVDDSLPDDYIPAPMSDALKTVLNPPPPENADKDKPNENQIVSKSSAKKMMVNMQIQLCKACEEKTLNFQNSCIYQF